MTSQTVQQQQHEYYFFSLNKYEKNEMRVCISYFHELPNEEKSQMSKSNQIGESCGLVGSKDGSRSKENPWYTRWKCCQSQPVAS